METIVPSTMLDNAATSSCLTLRGAMYGTKPSRACCTHHRLIADNAHLHPVSFKANIGCIDAENFPPLRIRIRIISVTVSDPF